MVHIGKRLKKMRLAKGLTQGDILKATGIMRCYTSRVESGHTMPGLEVLNRYAKVFGMPLHDFLYELTYYVPTPKDAATEGLQGQVEQESNIETAPEDHRNL